MKVTLLGAAGGEVTGSAVATAEIASSKGEFRAGSLDLLSNLVNF